MFTRSSRSHLDTRPRFKKVETSDSDPECPDCGDLFPRRRLELGYDYCLSCSKEQPKVANMHMHKQAATYTSNIKNINENQYKTHK